MWALILYLFVSAGGGIREKAPCQEPSAILHHRRWPAARGERAITDVIQTTWRHGLGEGALRVVELPDGTAIFYIGNIARRRQHRLSPSSTSSSSSPSSSSSSLSSPCAHSRNCRCNYHPGVELPMLGRWGQSTGREGPTLSNRVDSPNKGQGREGYGRVVQSVQRLYTH